MPPFWPLESIFFANLSQFGQFRSNIFGQYGPYEGADVIFATFLVAFGNFRSHFSHFGSFVGSFFYLCDRVWDLLGFSVIKAPGDLHLKTNSTDARHLYMAEEPGESSALGTPGVEKSFLASLGNLKTDRWNGNGTLAVMPVWL